MHIEYSSQLPTFGSGFYQTSYVINGERRYVGATQFQPYGGRYAFPHYDEPGYKAVFDLKITHNSSVGAISNTMGTDTPK
jgi:aminopeptidase N